MFYVTLSRLITANIKAIDKKQFSQLQEIKQNNAIPK